jgi:hypothetical protein
MDELAQQRGQTRKQEEKKEREREDKGDLFHHGTPLKEKRKDLLVRLVFCVVASYIYRRYSNNAQRSTPISLILFSCFFSVCFPVRVTVRHFRGKPLLDLIMELNRYFFPRADQVYLRFAWARGGGDWRG